MKKHGVSRMHSSACESWDDKKASMRHKTLTVTNIGKILCRIGQLGFLSRP